MPVFNATTAHYIVTGEVYDEPVDVPADIKKALKEVRHKKRITKGVIKKQISEFVICWGGPAHWCTDICNIYRYVFITYLYNLRCIILSMREVFRSSIFTLHSFLKVGSLLILS